MPISAVKIVNVLVNFSNVWPNFKNKSKFDDFKERYQHYF